MKQRKAWPAQNVAPFQKNIPTAPIKSELRQEIDQIATNIGKIVGKNPKKAAKLVESWINGQARLNNKKRAA